MGEIDKLMPLVELGRAEWIAYVRQWSHDLPVHLIEPVAHVMAEAGEARARQRAADVESVAAWLEARATTVQHSVDQCYAKADHAEEFGRTSAHFDAAAERLAQRWHALRDAAAYLRALAVEAHHA